MHRHYYINIFRIDYLYIINFGYATSKWSRIFKYYLVLFTAVSVTAVFGTVLVSLTSMYTSL